MDGHGWAVEIKKGVSVANLEIAFPNLSALMTTLLQHQPFHRRILPSFGRRFFEWNARVTAKEGKPAITGTKHVFVSAKIPVVMLKDVPGLGMKGEIVSVSRGHARHVLVPGKIAVFGTHWEMIDKYADPAVNTGAKVTHATEEQQRKLPFDWINDIEVRLVRPASSDGVSLREPVTIWNVLKYLSDHEELDLLPSDLTMPLGFPDGVNRVGTYKLECRLAFKTWMGKYSFPFVIESLEAVEKAEQERKRKLEEQNNKKTFGFQEKVDFRAQDYNVKKKVSSSS